MKIRTIPLAVGGGLLFLFGLGSLANVIPTNEWVSFRGNVTFNGQPTPVGSIVDAYDPSGVHCGTWTVGLDNPSYPDSAGIYGLMPVYRDDGTTPTVDEGADPGDSIFFKVNGRTAQVLSGNVIWGSHGDIYTVDLSATGTVAITGVDFPTTGIGGINDTVRFSVGVRNDGDGLDFYGITSTSVKGWQTINQSTFTYANPSDTAYLYFDVITPTWPGNDTTDTITFSVFSYLDTSQHVDSSVDLIVSITDVGEVPLAELPGGFHLCQNYPNPFNPTTTISFTLSTSSSVRLKVFDILGWQVNERNLGVLPSGDHAIDFEANGLPSGVYFYRLETAAGSQTRKMILLK